jgi:hypothetical protein
LRLEPPRGWIGAVAKIAPSLVALVAGLAHRDFRVGAGRQRPLSATFRKLVLEIPAAPASGRSYVLPGLGQNAYWRADGTRTRDPRGDRPAVVTPISLCFSCTYILSIATQRRPTPESPYFL